MKKILIAICVVSIFVITACKKENVGDANSTQQTDSEKIEALILDFKDKLNDNLKDGTTYMADSAVWYVEALLNYSYGYATALGCTFETDSVGTTVNSNGSNGYTLAQLNDVYGYLEEQALDNKPDDRYIFCIDVSISVEGNVTTFSSVAGYAKPLPDFKSTDEDMGSWYWGYGLGMCDSDSGSNIGMDATDIIEARVNNYAEYEYFVNIEYFVGSPNNYTDPNFPFTDPYLYPSRIFAFEDTVNHTDFCLSPDHIIYYSGKNGAIYVLNDLKPTNKDFAYCLVNCYSWQDTDRHLIRFYYGNPVEGP